MNSYYIPDGLGYPNAFGSASNAYNSPRSGTSSPAGLGVVGGGQQSQVGSGAQQSQQGGQQQSQPPTSVAPSALGGGPAGLAAHFVNAGHGLHHTQHGHGHGLHGHAHSSHGHTPASSTPSSAGGGAMNTNVNVNVTGNARLGNNSALGGLGNMGGMGGMGLGGMNSINMGMGGLGSVGNMSAHPSTSAPASAAPSNAPTSADNTPPAMNPTGSALSGPLVHPHQDLNDFLESFWTRQMDSVERETPDFKTYNLPLARIKKVMKSDEEVKMISAEAPIMFSKACEVFISELTCRAWLVAESHKRRTLQKSDVAAAIAFSDVFDFLIDIVPRDGEDAGSSGGGSGGGNGGGNNGNGGTHANTGTASAAPSAPGSTGGSAAPPQMPPALVNPSVGVDPHAVHQHPHQSQQHHPHAHQHPHSHPHAQHQHQHPHQPQHQQHPHQHPHQQHQHQHPHQHQQHPHQHPHHAPHHAQPQHHPSDWTNHDDDPYDADSDGRDNEALYSEYVQGEDQFA